MFVVSEHAMSIIHLAFSNMSHSANSKFHAVSVVTIFFALIFTQLTSQAGDSLFFQYEYVCEKNVLLVPVNR